MTLTTIVERAAQAYPDTGIALPKPGNALAEFVVSELCSVYNPSAMDSANIATAVGALQRASDELAGIAHAVSDLARPKLAA